MSVHPAAFEAHIERHGARASPHLEDLHLALACAQGDHTALRHLDRELDAQCARAARRSRGHGLDAADLAQRARATLLLMPGDGAPKIAEYAGRGPLRTWLRVVIARVLVDHQRVASGREPVAMGADIACALEDLALDPELQCAREELRAQVRTALESALSSLDAEGRALLRLRYVDALGVDGVALAHGVHRATAARRLTRAENALRGAVRSALAEQLRMGSGEAASALRSILSQVELSLSRLLA